MASDDNLRGWEGIQWKVGLIGRLLVSFFLIFLKDDMYLTFGTSEVTEIYRPHGTGDRVLTAKV